MTTYTYTNPKGIKRPVQIVSMDVPSSIEGMRDEMRKRRQHSCSPCGQKNIDKG